MSYTEQVLMSEAKESPGIVVCGAGIIGASVAYQLALRGVACTVLEKCDVACAASGKAGGFLALDWCDGSSLKNLARPSFAMHEQQATDLQQDIGYRRMDAYAVSMTSSNAIPVQQQRYSRQGNKTNAPEWLTGEALFANTSCIATRDSGAQVHPRKLTNAYLSAARRLVGTSVDIASVVDIEKDASGKEVKGVYVEKTQSGRRDFMSCSKLVLAMGPWTIDAVAWFPTLPPIMANKATSIVLPCVVPAQAIFSEFLDSNGDARSPEAYPRSDELYICGGAAQDPLPSNPEMIEPRKEDVSVLVDFAEQVSEESRGAKSRTEQACYLPITPDGIPIIGAVPDVDNAFVAAGHGCWGILNSPATGKALAELILDGTATSVNLAPFEPKRFVSMRRKRK